MNLDDIHIEVWKCLGLMVLNWSHKIGKQTRCLMSEGYVLLDISKK